MHQLVVYVPDSHIEVVKGALFAAGAGQIGAYSQCSWQVLGTGQFLPSEGAAPFVGAVGQVERLPEWRLEVVVDDGLLQPAIAALKAAHPYEEPAFHALRLDWC